MTQVSETEREDFEESEKTQHWVEKLCQTRLEQISSVENESPEVTQCSKPSTVISKMCSWTLLFLKAVLQSSLVILPLVLISFSKVYIISIFRLTESSPKQLLLCLKSGLQGNSSAHPLLPCAHW